MRTYTFEATHEGYPRLVVQIDADDYDDAFAVLSEALENGMDWYLNQVEQPETKEQAPGLEPVVRTMREDLGVIVEGCNQLHALGAQLQALAIKAMKGKRVKAMGGKTMKGKRVKARGGMTMKGMKKK